MDKKSAARILYMQGVKQQEIANIFKISQQTVSRWKNEESWDKARARSAIAKHTAEEDIYELIAYNIDILKKMKEQWAQDPNNLKLIPRGDIDALTKLFASVKGREVTFANYVAAMREFLSYLQEQDLELSQRVGDHSDNFLNLKRSGL